MDEDTKTASKSGGLSRHFNLKSIAGHLFSPTMIIMMSVMAFPAVAAATAHMPGGATIIDLGAALLDHYATMFTAPFTDGGVVIDAAQNTIEGNFDRSYEFGSGHGPHGGHGLEQTTDHSQHHLETPSVIPAETLDAFLVELEIDTSQITSADMEWLNSYDFPLPAKEVALAVKDAVEFNLTGTDLQEYILEYCDTPLDQMPSLQPPTP